MSVLDLGPDPVLDLGPVSAWGPGRESVLDLGPVSAWGPGRESV